MDDMERYGDYNEVDESPSKNPITTVLKATVAAVCFTVIGFLAFRIILFNYYPDEMKQLFFNDRLTEYYNSVDGDMEVLTQELRFPYDDPDEGNFFCENLLVIPSADQVQISLRYNNAICERFLEKYGVDISERGLDAFEIRLVRDPLTEKGDPITVGSLSDKLVQSLMMYNYGKLIFDGVDLGLDEGEDKVEWLRLELELIGAKKKTVFAVPIYENNEGYSEFDEYKLSAKERP